MRFQIEAPRLALIAMQRRYPRADGWSTWWMDLDVACRWLRATYEDYDGACLIEGEHDDREPVATRLITELLASALGGGNAPLSTNQTPVQPAQSPHHHLLRP